MASGGSGPSSIVAVARVAQQTRLQHRLGELLDEQRHAVGARHDLLQHLRRQRLAAGDPCHHRRAVDAARGGDSDSWVTWAWPLQGGANSGR